MVLHVRVCGNSLRSDDRNILLFSDRHFRVLENAVAAPTAHGILFSLRVVEDANCHVRIGNYCRYFATGDFPRQRACIEL